MVGTEVGDVVGTVVGDVVGCEVGDVVGCVVGDVVGCEVGDVVGDVVGCVVGDVVGCVVGDVVGIVVGPVAPSLRLRFVLPSSAYGKLPIQGPFPTSYTSAVLPLMENVMGAPPTMVESSPIG